MGGFLVVGVVVAVALVAGFWLWSRSRASEDGQAVSDSDAESVKGVPEGTLDIVGLRQSLGIPGQRSMSESWDAPVVVPQNDGTALVLGDASEAASFGELIAQAGPRLESVGRRASAGVSTATAAAQRTGRLVKLHPDSVKFLKVAKLDKASGASGYVHGTLRGADGKYMHVVKIKQVANLQTLSSGAAVLSALAMQAQLDRIERSLAQIQASVDEVGSQIRDHADSKRSALDHQFGEMYRIAQQTGQFTRSQWEQLAPQMAEVYALRNETLRELGRINVLLGNLPSGAKARRQSIDKANERLPRVMANLDGDERLVGQAQVLRLWHLSVSEDPSLGATLEETRAQLDQRLQERESVLLEIEGALDRVDVKGLGKSHVFLRRRIRDGGHSVYARVRQHRIPITQEVHRAIAASPHETTEASEPLSQDYLAARYTLTLGESVQLVIAQSWMMSQDYTNRESRKASQSKDLASFQRACLEAIADLPVDRAPEWLPLEELMQMPSSEQSEWLERDSTVRSVLQHGAGRERSLLLLIELTGFHPWSPEDSERPAKTAVRWDVPQRQESLRQIAELMPGTSSRDADNVLASYQHVLEGWKDSLSKTLRNKWALAGLGAAGLAVGVLTAGLAAPAIGAMFGSAAFGLSGAAATSAGLAALGGGAIAAGGFGMAGGTVVVASAGGIITAGVLSGSAGVAGKLTGQEKAQVLARAAENVVKLRVLANVVILDELEARDQVRTVVSTLQEQTAVLNQRAGELEEELQDLNKNDAKYAAADDERDRVDLLTKLCEQGSQQLLRRLG